MTSLTDRPLRILMVCHMPWNPNAGGSRVQIEIAEEWRKLGHRVEKFSQEDAYPQGISRLSWLVDDFPQRARTFVQRHGQSFDIIDAHQGNLPFSKQDLMIQGLLVARTVGLYVFVDEFLQLERQWRGRKFSPKGMMVEWMQRRNARNYPRSLKHCDLINVPNHDELVYLRDRMGWGQKTVVFPFGLSDQRLEEISRASQPAIERHAHQTVVFIGGWQPRKGSRDWGEIICNVRDRCPQSRFLFLGTGIGAERLLSDCGLSPCDWITVVPSYDSSELPQLLSCATVGAFPSYMEGFGFSVLEKLAAGIPVVAYDVPGPREMLRHLPGDTWLTPVGDRTAFCKQLVNVLTMHPSGYAELARQSVEVASKFRWREIAANTLATYMTHRYATNERRSIN